MIQFDEHIFQMGWNHQLVDVCKKPAAKERKVSAQNCTIQFQRHTSYERLGVSNGIVEVFGGFQNGNFHKTPIGCDESSRCRMKWKAFGRFHEQITLQQLDLLILD